MDVWFIKYKLFKWFIYIDIFNGNWISKMKLLEVMKKWDVKYLEFNLVKILFDDICKKLFVYICLYVIYF